MMEEQIKYILDMSCEHFVAMPSKCKQRAAKEITAHIFEFIDDLLMLKIYDWDWGNDIKNQKVHHFLNGEEVEFEEVYQYWLTNVKK